MMTSDDTPLTDAPAAPTKQATRTRKATTDTIAVAAQADTKPEFAPTVTATGRLDHSTCGHPRTLSGRSACRAAQKAAQAAATEGDAK